MNILITIILAAVVAYVAYLIALALPFLAGFATIVGLVVFLLIVLGGYHNSWTFPARRP